MQRAKIVRKGRPWRLIARAGVVLERIGDRTGPRRKGKSSKEGMDVENQDPLFP